MRFLARTTYSAYMARNRVMRIKEFMTKLDGKHYICNFLYASPFYRQKVSRQILLRVCIASEWPLLDIHTQKNFLAICGHFFLLQETAPKKLINSARSICEENKCLLSLLFFYIYIHRMFASQYMHFQWTLSMQCHPTSSYSHFIAFTNASALEETNKGN